MKSKSLLSGFVFSAAVLVSCALAQHPVVSRSPSHYAKVDALKTRAQLRDWSMIWTFVDEKLVFRDFRGVDWRAMRDTVAARIRAGLDDEAFTALMVKTMDRFRDGHTRYTSPEIVRSETASSSGLGLSGVGLNLMPGNGVYLVVAGAVPGGPADRAGIDSHDRIIAVDGRPPLDSQGRLSMLGILGPAGSRVRLLVRSQGREEREVVLLRTAPSPGGEVSGRMLGGEGIGRRRIAFIRIDAFQSLGLGEDLRAEYGRLSEQGPLDGLIIDLRTNGGGLPKPLLSSMGLFLEGEFGASAGLGQTVAFVAEGDAVLNSRTVPLVVLVHGTSNSEAEIFAGALQAAGRARLVGGRTAGNVGGQRSLDLPGGGLLLVCSSTFVLQDGRDPGWLGRGLVPDYAVEGSAWEDFSGDGDDPCLAKAISLL